MTDPSSWLATVATFAPAQDPALLINSSKPPPDGADVIFHLVDVNNAEPQIITTVRDAKNHQFPAGWHSRL